jgi:formamidopyrimidine-DNA glycosylase
MPELPEVETIRRELEPLLKGRRIVRVKIGRPDIVGWPKANALEPAIATRRIERLERRGKYLVLRLGALATRNAERDSPKLLIIHLRLSGHLKVMTSRAPAQRFERIRFVLSGGRALVFVEPRVLGRVYAVMADRLPPVLRGLQDMGLEPIHPEFDANYLRAKVGHRTASIKGLLLDQSITAGIGNIYSDEALFRSGIRPMRPAHQLRPKEYPRLAQALREVLHDGIRHMGTTMSDSRYRRPRGMPGGFQKHLMVFDREGEPCRVCGSVIRSCRIGNRTTRYCPKCQK